MEGSTPLRRGEDRVLSLLFLLSEAFIRNIALTTPFTAPLVFNRGGGDKPPSLCDLPVYTPS